jgi:hypothetical protein
VFYDPILSNWGIHLKKLTNLAVLACLVLVLSACGGIPLRSVPKLYALQSQLLDANPADFMVAIQADSRLTPPTGSAPVLSLVIKPTEAGAFESVDKKLAMRSSPWSANLKGLEASPPNRRWLVYSFTPESQAELSRIQAQFKRVKEERKGKSGGTVQIGIAQENVAAKNPELANTKWESWLQTSKADGFFELWTGTLGELTSKGH